MRADDERGRCRIDSRRHPPRPEVGVAVELDVESAGLRRRDEPRATVELGGVEGIAAIAAGRRVAPDRLELGPQAVEHGHASDLVS